MVADFDFGAMRDRRTIGAVRSGNAGEGGVEGMTMLVEVVGPVESRALSRSSPLEQDAVTNMQETARNTVLVRLVNIFLL